MCVLTINKTKTRVPRLPVIKIKNDILGEKYSLSLAFISSKISREINKKYRNKNKVANVLSFSFSKNEGEIVLCPFAIKKDTKKFQKNFEQLIGFLIIHAMLHLKGIKHSSIMEKREQKYYEKYFNRNRCGVKRYKNCNS